MQLSQQLKKNLSKAIKANYEARNAKVGGKYTNRSHAHWLALNNSVHHRLLKGETEGLLSEGEWIRIGKQLLYDFDGLSWKTANTKTHLHIKAQLQACRENSIGGILADDSSLGKTYTASLFALEDPNVCLVDCSRISKWSDLLRAMCRGLGLSTVGKLTELRRQLVEQVLTLDHPLIILDEAGDISDTAVMQLKGLWNELENMLGWYMMGANGLRFKMENKLAWNKVGYEELFNRLGNRFQAITQGMTSGEKEIMKRRQIEAVLRLNAPQMSKEELSATVAACDSNLRRCRTELLKLKTKGGSHA